MNRRNISQSKTIVYDKPIANGENNESVSCEIRTITSVLTTDPLF